MYELPEADKYVFDFSGLKWCEPFGMLYLSSQLKAYRRSKPDKRFVVKNCGHLTYPGHMGFFQSFGLDFGKSAGEAPGNSHYLPITTMHLDPIEQEAKAKAEYLGTEIERISQELATLLSQRSKGMVVDVLRYAFREIIRNVFEHSGADEFDYCAQYWNTGRVEISVLDTGMGIKNALSANPHLQLPDDKAALKCSVLPGISGKMYRGVKSQPGNPWENSGFGLYMANRLCNHGGSFLMCSGEHGMIWKGSTRRGIPLMMNGTALRLTLNINALQSVENLIDRFVKEGEEIATWCQDGNPVTASKASKMLGMPE